MDAIKPLELKRLTDVRNLLLRLHKALLDGQRAHYEKEHGRVESPGALLQLAISDPAFEWLHRFSELVVEIDESTEGHGPLTSQAHETLLKQTRQLMEQEQLQTALAENPDASKLATDLQSRLTNQ